MITSRELLDSFLRLGCGTGAAVAAVARLHGVSIRRVMRAVFGGAR